MLATLADPPLAQPGLIYEPKYDGIRALVDLRPDKGGHVRIYSRNGNDKTSQFPGLAKALAGGRLQEDAGLRVGREVRRSSWNSSGFVQTSALSRAVKMGVSPMIWMPIVFEVSPG